MNLTVCPRCARQYDVTHHPPRSRVRCVCDEVFEVGWRSPLSVANLACAHCGGAVAADDDVCPYCSRRLCDADRRHSTLCPRCFARMRDDAQHCRACGTSIRPQALSPLPEDRGCPRCDGELRIRMLGPCDAVECAGCGGLWLQPSAFEEVCADARNRSVSGFLPKPGDAPVAEREVRYIPCLTCGELMTRRQFRHGPRSSGVVLDYCKDHGVWFDFAELEKVVAFLRTHGHLPLDAAPSPSGGTDSDWNVPRDLPTPFSGGLGTGPGWLLQALRFLGDLVLHG